MRTPASLFLCLVACLCPVAIRAQQKPSPEVLKQAAAEMVEGRRKFTQEMVDSIFSFAELGYQEHETAKHVTAQLEKEGFKIERGVAGMPTAFVASWGSGKPVIGLMADIDGLPETSQKPGVAFHDPLIPNGPGHGEGHNAGQAVNVTAAIVVKNLMERYKIPGTIRVYPGVAEELIGSRTYMVNAGLFKDLDVMLSSHIDSDFGTTWGPRGTGLVSTVYTFHGSSAHGAGSPWRGRSALDAVELMNVGWNYRREHLRPEQRSHYVITNGGDQPNVVPPLASVWYYFREWDYDRIEEMHAIGTKIAQAAAQMTDTTMEEKVIGAAWPGHFNKPVAEALFANIKRVGMPAWDETDQKFAKACQAELKVKQDGLKTKLEEMKPGAPMQGGYGSDDIAEVSWNLPTVVLRFPGNVPGMIGHHWSSGMSMATPIAHKGATAGAAAHAMTAIDLLTDPALLDAAKKYFEEQTKEQKWKSLIPVSAKPPIHLNADKMEKVKPELEKLRYNPARYKTYMEQLGIQYPTVR
ncbi:MAG TPA: amidohydrolase [Bryobacteraceae bacterium]|nr:amidohydrolase [Bryobacteraceae bacterium]